MHARAIAEHLAKTCAKNLDAPRPQRDGKRIAELDRDREPYVVVTTVFKLDELTYMFSIEKRVFSKAGRRVAWSAPVYVTTNKEVYVEGNAPKHIVNCLEGSYTDLRAKQRDDY